MESIVKVSSKTYFSVLLNIFLTNLHTPKAGMAHWGKEIETDLTATGLSGNALKVVELISVNSLANRGSRQKATQKCHCNPIIKR